MKFWILQPYGTVNRFSKVGERKKGHRVSVTLKVGFPHQALSGLSFANYVSTVSTQARHVSTKLTQDIYVSTMFDRGITFRPSSTEKKFFYRVRTKIFFDREEFWPRKISSTTSTGEKFLPSSNEDFFDREEFRPKKISSTTLTGEKFLPSSNEDFFDREEFRPRKISSTMSMEKKNFDRIRSRSFFDWKKNI